jgi:phosphoribulokinase
VVIGLLHILESPGPNHPADYLLTITEISHLSQPNSMLVPKIRLKFVFHILSDPLLAVILTLDVT